MKIYLSLIIVISPCLFCMDHLFVNWLFRKGSKVISWFIAFILAPLMSKSYCFLIHETRNSHIYYFHFLILHVYQVQDIENNHIKKLYFCTQGKYESFVRQKIKKKSTFAGL